MPNKQSIPKPAIGLHLADGTMWSFESEDEEGIAIISQLAKAMKFKPLHGPAHRLHVAIDRGNGCPSGAWELAGRKAFTSPPSGHEPRSTAIPRHFHVNNQAVCTFKPSANGEMFNVQMMRLSLVLCQYAQIRGGLLLHGALAEHNGNGVLLVGPGGGGKTTASLRLPPHWRSLSDDSALVVCKNQQEYRAHPWPTWSTFMFGGRGGSWDVEENVRLRAIIFLEPADDDRLDPVNETEAVGGLINAAEEAHREMSCFTSKEVIRALRLQRFDNICELLKAVPCYHLYISLTGSFWDDIETEILY
ncbi:SynChlorMet cassette protein ScmC [Thermodesulfobacteriota bacterium]